jgi:hypothetical protein
LIRVPGAPSIGGSLSVPPLFFTRNFELAATASVSEHCASSRAIERSDIAHRTPVILSLVINAIKPVFTPSPARQLHPPPLSFCFNNRLFVIGGRTFAEAPLEPIISPVDLSGTVYPLRGGFYVYRLVVVSIDPTLVFFPSRCRLDWLRF